MHFFKSALSLDEFESNNSFAVGLVYLCPDKHLAAASSRRGPGLAGDSGSMHRPDGNDDDQIAVAILVQIARVISTVFHFYLADGLHSESPDSPECPHCHRQQR